MNILTLNTSTTNSTISVSGTTEDGMLAVGITVYDKTGTTQITVRTTAVVNNEYEYTVDGLEEGEYQICVADFDGGDCKTATVTLSATEDEDSTAGTPETGYHTIAKVEEPAPEANASATLPAVCISLAIGMAISAVIVFGARRLIVAKRKQ